MSSAPAAPLSGPARLMPGALPRQACVEFTASGEDHRVILTLEETLPVLRQAGRGTPHPSVSLLHSAVLMALQLAMAGKYAERDGVCLPVIGETERRRLLVLAETSRYGALTSDQTLIALNEAIAAFVDLLAHQSHQRTTQAAGPGRGVGRGRPASRWVATSFEERRHRSQGRLAERLAARLDPAEGPDPNPQPETSQHQTGRHDTGPHETGPPAPPVPELPRRVSLSLRVEAHGGRLVGSPDEGELELVLQVHDAENPLHVADARQLWEGSSLGPANRTPDHGFDHSVRIAVLTQLRLATRVWEPLTNLLTQATPDRLPLNSDEVVSLFDSGVAALEQIDIPVLLPRELRADLRTRQVLERMPQQAEALETGLFTAEGLFSFQWQVSLHGEPLTEAEMTKLADATRPVIKLRDNWIIVDPTIARRARERVIRTLTPAEALAATLALPRESAEVDVHDHVEPAIVGASLLRLRDQLLDAVFDAPPVTTPQGLQAELRHYQLQGLSWLATVTNLGLGGCLADDMGLGKTITMIALALHRWEADPTRGPILVVCPTSLMGNWEAEVAKFAPATTEHPGIAVHRFHGGRQKLEITRGPTIVLTTYGTAITRAAKLAGVHWDLVVADEAQHIKNAGTRAAKALRTFPATARVALTGTPVENNLTELWSILDWVIPGLLGSRNAFRRVWAAPIESGKNPSKADEFARLIQPFLLRRRKSDPGIAPELPAKTEIDHVVGLSREQAALYTGYVRDCMERIERADEQTRRGLVIKMLTGLKQICNHPAQFLHETNLDTSGRSQKLELLDELLDTALAEGGRVLIFTQYVAMGRLLEKHLAGRGASWRFLHGSVGAKQRDEMVAEFQTGEIEIFLLSLKAGGTGLNLTRADHVIHFDRWWNPAVEEQATDRAYRIGQTQPVQVHRMITQGTVEERVAVLLAGKRELADAVLAERFGARGEKAFTELGDADLAALVKLDQR